jgi:AmmeMemoRadiSam system protein B
VRTAGRPPRHAGSFYPADGDALRALVDRLLADAAGAQAEATVAQLRGVVVPHAGLEYSGPIAALGWQVVAAARPDLVVLLGADHLGRARGVAVASGGPWLCPAGAVGVDPVAAAGVVGLGPPFHADDAAHVEEHSLEVQLPFLALGCPGTPIVPMLVGGLPSNGPQGLVAAGERLAGLMASLWQAGRRPVLVATSDLAHYPREGLAKTVDRMMLAPVLAVDWAGLLAEERGVERARLPGLHCGMCGVEAVALALMTLGALGARRTRLLGHATSADAARGDAGRTVGYAAVAIGLGEPGLPA